MKLLVGLGNPGSQYMFNRHNIGFVAIDHFKDHYNGSCYREKFKGLVSEITVKNSKVILFKPQTFMNLSGQAIHEIISFYKIEVKNLYVLHDDLDIKLGRIKYKFAGSSAGHNGLRNIDHMLGNAYHRIRIGIDHPADRNYVSHYVLSNFENLERIKILSVIDRMTSSLPLLIENNHDRFIGDVNI